jgi:MerR family transcriptional regulator, light-induced transcriptional regulator
MVMTRGKNLTSKEVARLLGVSEASVKRWADSGLLPTAKTAGGHRRFSPRDVALFKRTGSNGERRRPVTRQLAERRLEKYLEAGAFGFGSEEVLVKELFRALLDGRTEDVSDLLINLHLHGRTVAVLADCFLCPPMREIGDLWHRGEISIAQEHVATRTAINAMLNLQAVMGMAEEKKRLALCCSVEEDFHELPVQLAALTLEAGGFEVVNMGTSTPFFALTEAFERFKPEVVCVASTLLHGLDRAAREYTEFHEAARRARACVVLGGAGFSDTEVRRRLPAELYAENFRQLEVFIGTLGGESSESSDSVERFPALY